MNDDAGSSDQRPAAPARREPLVRNVFHALVHSVVHTPLRNVVHAEARRCAETRRTALGVDDRGGAALLAIHDSQSQDFGVGIQPFVAPGPRSVLCASAGRGGE